MKKLEKRIARLEETINPQREPFDFLAMFSEKDQEAIKNAKPSPEEREKFNLLFNYIDSMSNKNDLKET